MEVCKHCQKEFQRKRGDQVYCSESCRDAAYAKRHRAYYREAGRKSYKKFRESCPIARCIYCGKDYHKTNARNQYCSMECYRAFQRSSLPALMAKLLQCPQCGTYFVRHAIAQKFCSRRCNERYNYRGITSRPSYVLFMKEKAELKAKMGNCCYLCGTKEGQLELHHLTYLDGNPYKELASNSKAWKLTQKEAMGHPENFRLLCRGCHSSVTNLGRKRIDAIRLSELLGKYWIMERTA